MKKYLRNLIIICTCVTSFFACTTNEIETYSGNPQIYFKWAIDGNDTYGRYLVDSLSYSFAFQIPSFTETIFNVPVKVQGHLSDTDRAFLVQVTDDSQAKQGVHFELPTSFVMPANENVVNVPITLIRAADLKDQEVSLKIKLVENENFDANLFGETTSSNANRPLNYNEFELTITDNLLTQPTKWEGSIYNFLGEYSSKKLYLYAEVNDISVPDWNEASERLDLLKARTDVLKLYLQEQKAAGTPVLEDDGTEMELGLNA